MDPRARVLGENLAIVEAAVAEKARRRRPAQSPAVRVAVEDLVAARTAVGMTQQDVASRMLTSTSAISRLECGVRSLPSLRTLERYARVVGAVIEIRIRRR